MDGLKRTAVDEGDADVRQEDMQSPYDASRKRTHTGGEMYGKWGDCVECVEMEQTEEAPVKRGIFEKDCE